jgi:opacity protein-like surface antigen
VLGGGAEYMFASNITGRVEFLHYDFGDEEFLFRFDIPSSDFYDLFGDVDFDVNVIRAGVNILF